MIEESAAQVRSTTQDMQASIDRLNNALGALAEQGDRQSEQLEELLAAVERQTRAIAQLEEGLGATDLIENPTDDPTREKPAPTFEGTSPE
jgi:peptidoglycan hydrolase CwlO-like protein